MKHNRVLYQSENTGVIQLHQQLGDARHGMLRLRGSVAHVYSQITTGTIKQLIPHHDYKNNYIFQ